MVLVIDNYDSFTYNLVQYIQELGEEVVVRLNDCVTVEEIEKLGPEYIVISPGPCTPLEAGVSNQVIKVFAGKVPILGVCLGHQCIGYVFGAKIGRNWRLMHGKTSLIYHHGSDIFTGIPSPFIATRYHSLVILPDSLPDCLQTTAWTAEGEIMAVRHKELAVYGVQFHPESILSEHGHALLKNFLSLGRKRKSNEPVVRD